MGKNKSSKFFQGKEAFQRMNFLFQASEFLVSHLNQPRLAAYYGSQMTSICKKSVLRMEPKVKRQLCKGCRVPLVAAVTSRMRLKSKSKNIIITCLQCGTIKRFPTKPGYKVWVETDQACVETLTTANAEPRSNIKGGDINQNINQKQSAGNKGEKGEDVVIQCESSNNKLKQVGRKFPDCIPETVVTEVSDSIKESKK